MGRSGTFANPLGLESRMDQLVSRRNSFSRAAGGATLVVDALGLVGVCAVSALPALNLSKERKDSSGT